MPILRYLLVTLALTIAAGIGGILLLAATPGGFGWLADNADRVVPGELLISEPEGSLLTTMRATELRYTMDDLEVTATALRVRLNWLALIAGEVRLSRLHADRLTINLATGEATDSGNDPALPSVDLPVALRIVAGSVDELLLDIPGYRGQAADLRMRAALRDSRLRVLEFAGVLADLPVQLTGDLRMRDNWDYAGTVRARLDRKDLPAAQLQTRFAGDLLALRLDDTLITTLGGTLAGNARLSFADLGVEATLLAADIDLTSWQSGLPVLRAADFAISGRLPDALEVALTDAYLEQDSREATLQGRIRWNGETLQTPGLQLAAGSNRVDFNGELYPAPQGSFALAAPDPGLLLPGLSGDIVAGGNVTAGESLRLQVIATATDITWADTMAERLELAVAGTPAEFDWRINAVADTGNAQLDGAGAYTSQELAFTIAAAALQPAGQSSWQLDAPLTTRVTFGAESAAVTVDAHCWSTRPWRVCLETAAWSPQAIELNAKLAPVNLADLPVLADIGYRVEGSAAAELQLSGSPDNPVGRLSWNQQDTLLAWTDEDGNTLQSVFAEVLADVQLRDRRLRLNARAASDTGVTFTATGDSAAWQGGDTPVAGRLTVDVPDISLFAPLLNRFAELDNAIGELTAGLRLSGTVAQPVLLGTAELTDGRATVRALGIELQGIEIDISADDMNELTFEGSAISGDGRLNIAGTAGLDDSGNPLARIAVQGDNVTLLRFPQQIVAASPDLQLGLTDNTLTIDGAIAIPYADITVEEVPASAAAPSRDARVIRAAEPERRRDALTVISNIRLQLGDDVSFKAFGLETQLDGQLRLYTTADNQLPYLDSNLRSRAGSFSAFGRQLAIERGVLVFSGVPDNPTVDVRAVRKLRYQGQDVTVVVRLSGPLQAMRTRLSGEPAMSESDALSYLVLNRPARRDDTGEAEQLSAAAMALGLINLLPQTETLRTKLGFDEIGFEGSTQETSAITAGRRIGDDFYIRYSYGLFDRIGRFIIRYDIGRGFSLEAGSGQEQTIDLLYSIDR